GNEEVGRLGTGRSFVGKPLQDAEVALALEHRVDRGGRGALPERMRRRGDVKDAVLGLEAEPISVALPQRAEGHVLRNFGRAADRLRAGLRLRRRRFGERAGAGQRRNAGEAGGLQKASPIGIHWASLLVIRAGRSTSFGRRSILIAGQAGLGRSGPAARQRTEASTLSARNVFFVMLQCSNDQRVAVDK